MRFIESRVNVTDNITKMVRRNPDGVNGILVELCQQVEDVLYTENDDENNGCSDEKEFEEEINLSVEVPIYRRLKSTSRVDVDPSRRLVRMSYNAISGPAMHSK